MEKIAEVLSNFVSEKDFSELPEDVVKQVKKCVLDLIGVSIAGSRLTHIQILANFVKATGGTPEATIIGYPIKTSCLNAGLVNGAMGHALQMDDGDMASIAHLGTEVIPAAMGIAEKKNSDGQALLTAITMGYEGAIRIGDAVNPSHNKRGFSPNGTIGVFGAAIATGKILDLNKTQLADAIGSAAMQASGLEEFVHDGSMSKFLNTGHATQAGILSALLAKRGFTGSHSILEGRKGFCRAYSDEYETKKIYSDLEEKYQIMETYFKPYPTCRYIHPATDAILSLVNRVDIPSNNIKEVVIQTYPVVINTVDNPQPQNVIAATLSMQYSIATAILEKRSTPKEFTEPKLNDEDVINLMRRINLVTNDEIINYAPEGKGVIVKVITSDNKEYEERIRFCKGEPENPFTEGELVDKFRALTSPIIPDSKITKIIDYVHELEDIDNVREFTELLTTKEEA